MAAAIAIVGGFGSMEMVHPRLGLFITALVIVVTYLGRFSGNWDTRFTIKYNWYIRLCHWSMGYTAYVLGLVNGYLGVRDITLGTPYGCKYLLCFWLWCDMISVLMGFS